MSALPYQYVVLRCVPRVDREEFVNVGVALYCQQADFLAVGHRVDAARLASFAPSMDPQVVDHALAALEDVCRGSGPAAGSTYGERFGFIKAPRSTVVQPGPVHGGVTDQPAAELERLLGCLVDRPDGDCGRRSG
jgi:hypothetical protein